MTSAALISLRETLETSIVVGIMLALLSRTDQQREKRTVWLGVGAGVAASILVAFAFRMFASSLTEEAEELYEGILMLTAAGLLLWMILWMMRAGSSMKASVERNVSAHAMRGSSLGIFFLSFTTTAREGTEMVLFLNAALINAKSDIHHLVGALAGMTGAILLACAIFRGTRRYSLRAVFNVTGVLLLLFAAGLVAHGIGELQEAHVLPFLQSYVWDMTTILPEESLLGGILESMIGYSDHPTVLQMLAYVLTLSCAALAWTRIRTKQRARS